MSIRRSIRSQIERKIRQREMMQRKRKLMRRLGMESLEDRRMLAAGPQLEGILPDSGSLLTANETLNTAPSELTFNFDSNDVIDQNTVGGIQIWRSGNGGVFTPAVGRTDLGTNGAVAIERLRPTPWALRKTGSRYRLPRVISVERVPRP